MNWQENDNSGVSLNHNNANLLNNTSRHINLCILFLDPGSTDSLVL